MVITCRTCKKQKPEESFGFYAGHRRRNCGDCRKWLYDYNKRNREHLLEIRRFRYHTDLQRKVAKANAKYMRKIRGNPVRKVKLFDNHLKRMYGIDLEIYGEMLKRQDNKCAICRTDFKKIKGSWDAPCVDHCHRTHKVRGVLCKRCNITLSYYENFKYQDAAREYLRVNEVGDKEPLR